MPRLSGSLGMATPSVKVSKTTGVLGNDVELLTAKYPVGDTIDALECDSSVTRANLGSVKPLLGQFEQLRHNKIRKQRWAGATGTVVRSPEIHR
jgi:hypothetical protein